LRRAHLRPSHSFTDTGKKSLLSRATLILRNDPRRGARGEFFRPHTYACRSAGVLHRPSNSTQGACCWKYTISIPCSSTTFHKMQMLVSEHLELLASHRRHCIFLTLRNLFYNFRGAHVARLPYRKSNGGSERSG
jgi:hypothetical protein